MAKQNTEGTDVANRTLTPPRMTKAEWLKRDKGSVTLRRGDLEYLAQVIAAGRVLIRDTRAVPSQLKALMTRLGVSTQGL